jgi:hypothetical protein
VDGVGTASASGTHVLTRIYLRPAKICIDLCGSRRSQRRCSGAVF